MSGVKPSGSVEPKASSASRRGSQMAMRTRAMLRMVSICSPNSGRAGAKKPMRAMGASPASMST
jgi:hypothetical protein